MPNIPEFEARAADAGLRPAEGGAEAFAREGQHVEGVYARLGQQLGGGINDLGTQWEHHVTVQSDLATLKLQSAQLVSRQGEWKQAMAADATAPVHNPNILTDLQTKWAKEDEDYNATLPTQEAQQFHQEQAIRQRQHFAEVGMADMASLAAHQGLMDVQHTGVYSQTAAYNDPTSIDHNLGTIDAAVDAQIRVLGPNASAEGIAAMKEEGDRQRTGITLAAARGTIANAVDPVGGAPGSGIGPAVNSFLESAPAKLYLNEAQQNEIRERAQAVAHAKTQDAYVQEEHQHRQLEWQSQDAMGQYQKILGDSFRPGGSLPADFISTVLQDPHLQPGDRDTMVGLAHRMQTEAANVQTGQGVLHSLLGRVVLPEGDPHRLTPTEVMQHIGVDLSRTDGDFLLERLKPAAEAHDRLGNIMLEQTLREARAFLVPHDNLTNLDPAAKAAEEHNMSGFETWFVTSYENGLRAGKTPTQLLDKGSPDYLLKGDKITSFGPAPGALPPGPAGGSQAAPVGGNTGTPSFQLPWWMGGATVSSFKPNANMLDMVLTQAQKAVDDPARYSTSGPFIAGVMNWFANNTGDGTNARMQLPAATMDRITDLQAKASKAGIQAGQAAPAGGTAGQTAVAPASPAVPLTQQQVDAILAGK